jgi:hypothetical protein
MKRYYEIADVCRFRASTMESKPAATKSKSGAPKSKSNAPKSKSAATKSKCLLFPRIQASQRVIIEFGERRIPGAAFSAPRVFPGGIRSGEQNSISTNSAFRKGICTRLYSHRGFVDPAPALSGGGAGAWTSVTKRRKD